MKKICASDLSKTAQDKWFATDGTVYAKKIGRGWKLATLSVSGDQREKAEAQMEKDGWMKVVNG